MQHLGDITGTHLFQPRKPDPKRSFFLQSNMKNQTDENRNMEPDLTVDELLLHVHVFILGLKGRAEGGPGAEQPVVQLLCLAVVTLQRLFLSLLL